VKVCVAPDANDMGNDVGDVSVKLSAAPLSPSDATIPARGIEDDPFPVLSTVIDSVAVEATVDAGKVTEVVPMPLDAELPL